MLAVAACAAALAVLAAACDAGRGDLGCMQLLRPPAPEARVREAKLGMLAEQKRWDSDSSGGKRVKEAKTGMFVGRAGSRASGFSSAPWGWAVSNDGGER